MIKTFLDFDRVKKFMTITKELSRLGISSTTMSLNETLRSTTNYKSTSPLFVLRIVNESNLINVLEKLSTSYAGFAKNPWLIVLDNDDKTIDHDKLLQKKNRLKLVPESKLLIVKSYADKLILKRYHAVFDEKIDVIEIATIRTDEQIEKLLINDKFNLMKTNALRRPMKIALV